MSISNIVNDDNELIIDKILVNNGVVSTLTTNNIVNTVTVSSTNLSATNLITSTGLVSSPFLDITTKATGKLDGDEYAVTITPEASSRILNVSSTRAFYTRMNDIVTVYFRFRCDYTPPPSGTNNSFTITIPIDRPNLDSNDLIGTCSFFPSVSEVSPGIVQGKATTKLAQGSISDVGTSHTNDLVCGSFSYIID